MRSLFSKHLWAFALLLSLPVGPLMAAGEKLDLEVWNYQNDPTYKQPGIRITNYGSSPIALNRLKVKVWVQEALPVVSDPSSGSVFVYDSLGAFQSTTSTPRTGVVTAFGPTDCGGGRQANTQVSFQLNSPTLIPANGGYAMTPGNEFGQWRRNDWGVWDASDDYSRVVGAANEGGRVDTKYFGLYLDDVLVCEWKNASTMDPNTGEEPCGIEACSILNTPTFTVTPTPTLTITRSSTSTVTVTVVSAASATPTPFSGAKLDLEVWNYQNDPTYKQPGIRITNYGPTPIALNRLKVKVWVQESLPVVSDPSGGSVFVYDSLGAFQSTTSTPRTGVVTAFGPTDCGGGRQANTQVSFQLNSPTLIPANGGYALTPGNEFGQWRRNDWGVWDASDDYSRVVGAANEGGRVDTKYFGLYLDDVLVCEWKNASTVDPNSGEEPCGITPCSGGATLTPTPSPSISPSPSRSATSTNTAVLSPTSTRTISPSPTASPTPLSSLVYEDFELGTVIGNAFNDGVSTLSYGYASTVGHGATTKSDAMVVSTAGGIWGASHQILSSYTSGLPFDATGATSLGFWIKTDKDITISMTVEENNSASLRENFVGPSVTLFASPSWQYVSQSLAGFSESMSNPYCSPNCTTMGDGVLQTNAVNNVTLNFEVNAATVGANVYIDDIAFGLGAFPTPTQTPTISTTSTRSPTFSASPSPSSTVTPTFSVSPTVTASPTPVPASLIYEDFELGTVIGNAFNDGVSTLSYGYTSAVGHGATTKSDAMVVSTAGGIWGASHQILSSYTSGLPFNATGATSLGFWIKTDKDITISMTVEENNSASLRENFVGPSVTLVASPSWQYVSQSLASFSESMSNPYCSPNCATMGDGVLQTNAVNNVTLNFEVNAATVGANVYIDDIAFGLGPVPTSTSTRTPGTPSPSSTITPLSTSTPTKTVSVTSTGTMTVTLTTTPLPSSTSTNTLSSTPTRTPTASSTVTASPTASATATSSVSPSPGPTPLVYEDYELGTVIGNAFNDGTSTLSYGYTSTVGHGATTKCDAMVVSTAGGIWGASHQILSSYTSGLPFDATGATSLGFWIKTDKDITISMTVEENNSAALRENFVDSSVTLFASSSWQYVSQSLASFSESMSNPYCSPNCATMGDGVLQTNAVNDVTLNFGVNAATVGANVYIDDIAFGLGPVPTSTFTAVVGSPTSTSTVSPTSTFSVTLMTTATLTPTQTPSPGTSQTSTGTATQTPLVVGTFTSTTTPTQTPSVTPSNGASPVATLPGLSPGAGKAIVYPSPVKGSLFWVGVLMEAAGSVRVEIFNERADLAVVQSVDVGAGQQVVAIDSQALAAGVYFYRAILHYQDGTTKRLAVGKFIVIK